MLKNPHSTLVFWSQTLLTDAYFNAYPTSVI